MLALEGVLDQLLRSPGVRDAGIELGDLALGQAVPGRALPARRCEQRADLRKGEPGVLVKANERDALYATAGYCRRWPRRSATGSRPIRS